MIRILLSLAIAAAAYFGPWLLDSTGQILGASFTEPVLGSAFVDSTIGCLMDGKISMSGECAPAYGLFGQLVLATVALGVLSAALSVIGLVPLIGRLTSLVTIVAGVAAIVTFGWFAKEVFTTEQAAFSDFRWGAYATAAFGLITIFAGLSGLRGDND